MIRYALLAAASLMTVATTASAKEFVTNGGFEVLTNGTGQLGFNTDATGWSTTGYNFVFGPGTGDTTGASGVYGSLKFWGTNDGGPDVFTNSPKGGNFVANDGAFGVQPLTQTLTGLVVGKTYNLNFDWAAAQQYTYNGATTEQWVVSLGTETHSTIVYANPDHGFSGWMNQSFSFTAQSTTSVLSFQAVGTPDGLPPFSLLDSVSVTGSVPEPAQWALMLGGFGLLGATARRRRTTVVAPSGPSRFGTECLSKNWKKTGGVLMPPGSFRLGVSMFGKAFLAATALVALAGPAQAANLVVNGSFESSIFTVDPNYSGFEFSVQSGNPGGVTGWTATGPDANEQGINFYYNDVASATTKTIFNRYGDQAAKLANTFTGASPDGGNFVGFDSDHIGDGAGAYNANFAQVITGLDTTKTYTLKFYWAGTQLQNRSGPTTDKVIYSLGSDVRQTAVFNVPNQGFTGWQTVTAYFTPTNATETLNFMSFGTPAGLPPFVLLDGVSLSVPEPAQWALMLGGFGLLGAASRRRRSNIVTA